MMSSLMDDVILVTRVTCQQPQSNAYDGGMLTKHPMCAFSFISACWRSATLPRRQCSHLRKVGVGGSYHHCARGVCHACSTCQHSAGLQLTAHRGCAGQRCAAGDSQRRAAAEAGRELAGGAGGGACLGSHRGAHPRVAAAALMPRSRSSDADGLQTASPADVHRGGSSEESETVWTTQLLPTSVDLIAWKGECAPPMHCAIYRSVCHMLLCSGRSNSPTRSL